jgi:hypothetical protein
MAADYESFSGTLPYASELFGIYQPLLGWKSKRMIRRAQKEQEVLLNAAVREIMKYTPKGRAIQRLPHPISPDDIMPNTLRSWAKTKVAKKVQDLAMRFYRKKKQPLTAANWKEILKEADLPKIITAVAKRERSLPTRVGQRIGRSQNVGILVKKEAVAAGLVEYLAHNAPGVLNMVFQANEILPIYRRSVIDPLSNFDPQTQLFVLSPIGLVHLFREYFFEFDSFLGPAVGQVWVSPGGSVELFEVHTRKTIQEKQVLIEAQTTTRSEMESRVEDELSSAVAQQNARNINFGVTTSASGSLFSVVEVSASASFGMQFNHQESQQSAHRHARQQSEKISNEIRRNFRTTFRTSVETQDTSSRRYILQNTTDELINYELRRKMRKVGVQVQHIATQLCWQTYVDEPGWTLGVGKLVHVAQLDDMAPSVEPPEGPPEFQNKIETIPVQFNFNPLDEEAQDDGGDETYVEWPAPPWGGVDEEENDLDDEDDVKNPEGLIQWQLTVPCNPPSGYILEKAEITSWATPESAEDAVAEADCDKLSDNEFRVNLRRVNFDDEPYIMFQVAVVYTPSQKTKDNAESEFQKQMDEYEEQKQRAEHVAAIKAIRERIKLASNIQKRSAEDLREEERTVIFRKLLHDLTGIQSGPAPHLMSELLRAIFDFDKMLYFVADEWWKPRTHSKQQLGVSEQITAEDQAAWGGADEAARDNYLITDESEPAPLGASLGWLLQLDGDEHRNAFLNSPWVKAIVPIRPGKEQSALNWLALAHVEGTDGLDAKYAGTVEGISSPTIEQAIKALAKKVKDLGHDIQNVLATETVYETGFDPLEGGFKATGTPFTIFDQWIEILPTDQVVALEYEPPKEA